MEVEKTLEGYPIRNARIPILLALRPIRDLLPHEETIPKDLRQLAATLRKDPVLRHPIIADKETGLVLDGTHRLAALSRLGCVHSPCALVSYKNPKIKVERWFRAVKGTALANFIPKVEAMKPREVDSSTVEERLDKRSCYASLEDESCCYVFSSAAKDSLALARKAFEIEKTARRNRLQITYGDEKIVPRAASNSFLFSTVRMEKGEILRLANHHGLLPPKTTRHIIPSRPLGIDVPLSVLKVRSLRKAQQMFVDHLGSKKINRVAPGCWVGSRRYQEEVFVFE